MAAAAATPGRRLLARPERRAAILRAAAAAFRDGGFALTSMEQVATAAGITRLIVYRHFESKEALYDAVLTQVSQRLAQGFSAYRSQGLPGSEAAVRALLEGAREDPAAFTLLWRQAAREARFADHAARVRAGAVEAARGLLGPVGFAGEGRRDWAAEVIVSFLVDGVLHWLDEAPPERDDDLVQLMSRSVPAMVRAWAEVPG